MTDEPAALVLYDAAKAALAEVVRVDEVKNVRDRMVAYQAYAKQAKDRGMLNDATDIRMRAERRAGELLRKMREHGERETGGRPKQSESATVTLAALGVTKTQSSQWQRLSDIAQEDFEKLVAAAQKKANAALDTLTTAEKAERRAAHEKALAGKIIALPNKRYGAILADPEWRFVPWDEATGSGRNPANHFATSTLEQIKSRDVASITADDCVLFLWATVPMLPQALEVMAAWGFEYRSHCAWLKDKPGTGHWFRNIHELLLLGVKGSPPGPAQGKQWESAWDAPVGEYAEKPELAYKLVEQYFPTMPKIELNARKKREGWDVWGAEAPVESGAAE